MFFLSISPAMAQKEWKDRYITVSKLDQRNPSTAMPADDSCTIVVWQDNSSGDWEIYAQKVDNNFGLARWRHDSTGLDGIPICRAPYNQINPRAAYDSAGGVIIVWEDYRDDPNNQVAQIYAQRILYHQGVVDPTWPMNGKPVAPYNAHQERPRIVGTLDGAYIAWVDWRNDPSNPPYYNRDIYVQYLLTDATTQNNWASGGINVSALTDVDQINHEMDLDRMQVDLGGGQYRTGVVIAYQDNNEQSTSTAQTIWTVKVADIQADATVSYQDVKVTTVSEEQINPRIVCTGKALYHRYTDPIVCWQDARDYQTAGCDIYAQRLDGPTGNRVWPDAAVAVCTAIGAQQNPVMTLWEHSISPSVYEPYVCIAWEDLRDGHHVYGGMLDSSGITLTPNGQDGEEICGLSSTNDQLSIDNFTSVPGVDTVHIAWRNNNGLDTDIRYQGIEIPSWTFVKASDGIPVTEAKNDQNLPQVCGRVFVWEDARRDPLDPTETGDYNIYCETPGECVGPTDMDWRDEFVQWTPGTNADNKRFVTDDAFSTFVVWDETRDGCRSVFVQKFDKDGVPRWKNNGILVSTAGLTARKPDVAADGSGGAAVVWQELNSSTVEAIAAENPCHPSPIGRRAGVRVSMRSDIMVNLPIIKVPLNPALR
jgi:hypothetical protein